MEQLSANSIQHLRFRSLELKIGLGGPQLALTTALENLVDAERVHRVGSCIRISCEKARESALQWGVKRNLLSPNRQHEIRLVAGNQARRTTRFDLITGRNHCQIALQQQFFCCSQRESGRNDSCLLRGFCQQKG